MTPSQENILELINGHPGASNAALGRMLLSQCPGHFLCADSARSAIRRARNGNKDGKGYVMKPIAGKSRFGLGNPFPPLPKGIKEFEDWHPVEFQGPLRSLVISDIHCPFHDKKAVELAIKYGRKNGANFVILNGDIGDFYNQSKFEHNPKFRNFRLERESHIQLLEHVRGSFPKSLILFKLGNHSERWDRHMSVVAPELFEIEEYSFESLLKLDKLGIESVRDRRPIKIGDLNVVHGHEWGSGAVSPINPARTFFLKAKAYVLGGHYHQSHYHTGKTIEGKTLAAWSTGCLCDLHPKYRVINDWSLGFAFVDVGNDNKFEVRNIVIKDGKIYGG